MHSTSAQMMAMANSFWPLAYSLKSYDLSLHPAFLSSAYRSLPTLPYPPPQNTTTPPTNSSSPPTTKSDKFSIDAILNKDKRSDSPSSVSSTEDIKKYSQTFLECDKLQESAFHRRQQRLFEAAHPYLGHTNAVQDLHHHNQHQSQQQQLSSAYRHLTESPRSQGKVIYTAHIFTFFYKIFVDHFKAKIRIHDVMSFLYHLIIEDNIFVFLIRHTIRNSMSYIVNIL